MFLKSLLLYQQLILSRSDETVDDMTIRMKDNDPKSKAQNSRKVIQKQKQKTNIHL